MDFNKTMLNQEIESITEDIEIINYWPGPIFKTQNYKLFLSGQRNKKKTLK